MQSDEGFRSRIFEIGASVFLTVVRDGIRRGEICVAGKTHGEVLLSIESYINRWIESDVILVDDHRSTLLDQARRAANENRSIIAVVLYATYFEHALNDIVLAGCARSKLDEAIAMRLIRSASIFDKTGELLTDIGLPELPRIIATSIRKVAELRNEFVHYKWTGRGDEETITQRKHVTDTIKNAEIAIADLEAYERENLLEGFDEIARVAKLVRREGSV